MERVMTEHDFRELLAARGYDEIRETDYEPKSTNELHTHEFSALLMVLDGEFILERPDGRETFVAGEMCDVPAGTVHAEASELGARVLAGLRHTPA